MERVNRGSCDLGFYQSEIFDLSPLVDLGMLLSRVNLGNSFLFLAS